MEITAAIAEKLTAMDLRETIRAQFVGNALYGLRCLGDSVEARQLVAVLTPQVQQCREDLNAQEVGNALYGLQRAGESAEMRALVAALAPNVRQCREDLTAQEIGNALSRRADAG